MKLICLTSKELCGGDLFPPEFWSCVYITTWILQDPNWGTRIVNAYCVWKLFFLTFHCLQWLHVKPDPLLNLFFGKGCPVEWVSHRPWRYGSTGGSVWSPAPRSLQSWCRGQERRVGVSADPRSRAETAHFTCYGTLRGHRLFPEALAPRFPCCLDRQQCSLVRRLMQSSRSRADADGQLQWQSSRQRPCKGAGAAWSQGHIKEKKVYPVRSPLINHLQMPYGSDVFLPINKLIQAGLFGCSWHWV